MKTKPQRKRKMSKLSEKIDRRMKELHIKQAELARRVSVSRATISLLLKRGTGTSIEVLKNIARVLEIPEEDILRDAGVLRESRTARRSTWAQDLIDRAERLEPEQQKLLDDFINVLLSRVKKNNTRRIRQGITT